YFCGVPITLRQQLIDAGARPDFAARRERGAGEKIARLRTVDVSLLRLLIVEATHEKHFFAKVAEWCKDLPQFHLLAVAFGPPLLRMEAVPGKKDRQSNRRFTRCLRSARLVPPDPK